MVQLSAAGLGVPSGAAYGLADALRQGTQGFLQGKQLAMQQRDQQMKQAAYEQALKKAQFELAQEQSQAGAQQQAGELLGQAGSFQPSAPQPPVGMQGQMLPSEQSRQADFQQLQQHHREVAQQAAKIAAKLDPKYAQQFWSDIQTGMKQDALNLARIHVSDSIHDAATDGSLDTVDPRTGQRVPNPDVAKQFAELADRVKSGEMDPIQAQGALDSTRQKLNQEAGVVQHRIMLADAASQQLLSNGMPSTVTPLQFAYIDGLRTGQISAEQWQQVSIPVLAGMVPDPSNSSRWITPEQAKLEAMKLQAQIADIQSKPGLAAERNANAAAAIEQRVGAQNANVKFRETKLATDTKQKELDRGSREKIAELNQRAQDARSASQTGFSDSKAWEAAVKLAQSEVKEGIIKDDEYEASIQKHYAKLTTKGEKKSSILDDIDKAIGPKK